MNGTGNAQPDQWHQTVWVELSLLLIAAPPLYFPSFFPPGAPIVGLLLLAGSWLWRRWKLGVWLARSPADLSLFLLLLVMLPVSLWVAPASLRAAYSIPRAYILVWNLSLFWTVLTH